MAAKITDLQYVEDERLASILNAFTQSTVIETVTHSLIHVILEPLITVHGASVSLPYAVPHAVALVSAGRKEVATCSKEEEFELLCV